MKKIIDETKLIIPPHISTLWIHVKSLYVKERHLVVELTSGEIIQVPGLTQDEIAQVFSCHASYLEKELHEKPKEENPFRFSFSSLDGMKSAMRHNPSQAGFPKLPAEIVGRIAQIAKLISPESAKEMDPPVEGCNCMYCQVTRAMYTPKTEEHEADVTEEDLSFQDWEIKEIGTNLYEVTSRLNEGEVYRVFLGDPVGCTCGSPHCEHIIAVLKS